MRVRPLVLAAAGIAATAVLAGCSSTGSMSGHQMSDGSTMSGPSMSAGMAGGQAGDVAFAQLMIPHHEQAIAMADLALDAEAEASTEVTALAEQIKSAQDPEIAQMTAWLQEWGAPTQMPGMSGDHSGMDMGGMTGAGMMSDEDMAALADASGADFDRRWLQMMIAHHEGAIDMAEQVQSTTSDPKVQELAQAVIDGQTAEIDRMTGLLAS